MLDLIRKTRTYRRFDENRRIDGHTINQLIDCARLGGSARNCQPWKYMAVVDQQTCAMIFPYLGWAGYLSDWKGPEHGKRPTAYILCLLNRDWLKGPEKEAHFDLGIATQNLLLQAMQLGIGGCRIGSFSPKLAQQFVIAENLELSLVIALGYPAEEVVLENLAAPDDIRYWRDADQVHHVPKRSLKDVLITLEIAE